jgi:hypothetical protein
MARRVAETVEEYEPRREDLSLYPRAPNSRFQKSFFVSACKTKAILCLGSTKKMGEAQ